jgi:hypothetical protein
MSSLLGPVTDADLRRWQRRRYDLLGEFLDLMDERGLPVLSWRVGGHALVGEATQLSSADRRDAYREWVAALGLEEWAPSTSDTGRTHLHAVTNDWRGRGVSVVVVADVWDNAEDGES